MPDWFKSWWFSSETRCPLCKGPMPSKAAVIRYTTSDHGMQEMPVCDECKELMDVIAPEVDGEDHVDDDLPEHRPKRQ